MKIARSLSILALSSLFAAALAGCPGPRPDDVLEPNDSLAWATPLVLGKYVDGRANQGNPDVFSVTVPAGKTLVFSMKDRGLEDCAGFTVQTADAILYQDTYESCSHSSADMPIEDGAGRTDIAGFGYEIKVPKTIAGSYYLTILERSEADNIAPFSWDYSVRATVDEASGSGVNP